MADGYLQATRCSCSSDATGRTMFVYLFIVFDDVDVWCTRLGRLSLPRSTSTAPEVWTVITYSTVSMLVIQTTPVKRFVTGAQLLLINIYYIYNHHLCLLCDATAVIVKRIHDSVYCCVVRLTRRDDCDISCTRQVDGAIDVTSLDDASQRILPIRSPRVD